MRLNLTLRIWLTVAAVVISFTVLVLYILPSQQEKYFLRAFEKEVENLATTVATGTEIAMKEGNYKGVEMAINFAKSDKRLRYVALILTDTIPNENEDGFTLEHTAMTTFPPKIEYEEIQRINDSCIVKQSPFVSEMMSGTIMVGFKTDEIEENMDRIRLVAIIVSIVVFVFGIVLGLWLANTISKPVRAIRDAAVKVGRGDLTQQVHQSSKDEIGELSNAFNKMVKDLSAAQTEIEEKTHRLEEEKERSEHLLLNILPAEIAEELKDHGEAKAKDFKSATILFTDFKQFTQMSEKLSAAELLGELNHCFKAFDLICEKYKIEKIKTIGDAYMAVGGVPDPSKSSTKHVVQAALEMANFIINRKKERVELGLLPFEMRAGIHTGPVVAGIVGVKKFQYDIWGDTVNTASRMESSGEVGKVNISQSTYELIKDDPQFTFEYRGKVQAKGKGEVDMYFVGLAN